MADIQNLETQYRLLHKYWKSGSEGNNVRDFQTADQLRVKMISQLESLLDEDNKDAVSDIFSDLAEFCHDYLLCLDELGRDSYATWQNLKSMAERAIVLNPDSFPGHYFLTVFHSSNLKSVHAGNIPAIHKGEDAATSIVGTAFNLLFKGATLGATATAAGISRAKFTTSVQNLLAVYGKSLQHKPIDARYYMKITSRMFNVADFCEQINHGGARDIYAVIKKFDMSYLDYSELEKSDIPDVQEAVLEYITIADSKL